MGTNLDVSNRHDHTHTDNQAVSPDSPAFERLKPGPGKSPDLVRASQRDRLHRAMIELAADEGHERVTVRALTRKAGISTRAFYSHFSNREECLAASVDRVGHELLKGAERSKPAAGREKRLRAGLKSLFGSLAAEPQAAQALLIEAPCSSRLVRTRAAYLTADLERLLGSLLAEDDDPSERLVLAIAAGVVRVATMATLTERLEELPALAPQLGDWALDIYGRQKTLRYAASEKRRPSDGERREPTPFSSQLSTIDPHCKYERILSAVSRVVLANGYADLTVSKIRREAGVSRREFDERFIDSKSCFLAAIESLAGRSARRAVSWAAGPDSTGKFNVRTVLALCAIGARNQRQAELVLSMILAPGRDGLRVREKLISEAAEWLTAESNSSRHIPVLEAEASVAATWRVAQREVLDGRAQALPRRATLFYALLS